MQRYVPYTANQPKNTEILVFAHIAQPYFEEMCISTVIFCPLVTSGEKPKAFFPLAEFIPFKCEYNSNVDIFVKTSHLDFQPIWQP